MKTTKEEHAANRTYGNANAGESAPNSGRDRAADNAFQEGWVDGVRDALLAVRELGLCTEKDVIERLERLLYAPGVPPSSPDGGEDLKETIDAAIRAERDRTIVMCRHIVTNAPSLFQASVSDEETCAVCGQSTQYPPYCIECDASGRSREHEERRSTHDSTRGKGNDPTT